MLDAWIGLGSNLGDRLSHLRRAVETLAGIGRVRARSAVYETAPGSARPSPPEATRPFLNAALWLETTLSPEELDARLRSVEASAGEARTQVKPGGKRALSLDVLLLGRQGDVVLVDGALTVPHPRLHLRAYALRPLLDLAPVLIHPALSLPLQVLYRLLPEGPSPRPRGWL